jgi:hypothetical protein
VFGISEAVRRVNLLQTTSQVDCSDVSLAHELAAFDLSWSGFEPEDGMEQIPARELERTMKVQEVILRAIAKKIMWWQAAEILGVSERTMRRWKWGYETHGFRALFDKRKEKPSWKKRQRRK